MITLDEALAELSNSTYGNEGSRELFKKMKEARLVAIYGYSDDIMMLSGAIDDEAYSVSFYNKNGMVVNDCDCGDDCPNFNTDGVAKIKAIFCKDVTFNFKTDIPVGRFTVMEDGEIYGYGGVFSLDNLK